MMELLNIYSMVIIFKKVIKYYFEKRVNFECYKYFVTINYEYFKIFIFTKY